MIKQNHFSDISAVIRVLVVLLGCSLSSVSAGEHKRVHVIYDANNTSDKHGKQINIKVKDKPGELSKSKHIREYDFKHRKQIAAKGYKTQGIASWYGYESGNVTADGHKFKPLGLSAAHKTLPLGTKARITNLENNKSVVVIINDRGPYIKGRIIDLSLGAARAIKMKGVGRVEIEALTS
jgi:rare lipoprotein A